MHAKFWLEAQKTVKIHSWRVKEFWVHNTLFMLYFAWCESWLSYINVEVYLCSGLFGFFFFFFLCNTCTDSITEIHQSLFKIIYCPSVFQNIFSTYTVQMPILLEFNINIVIIIKYNFSILQESLKFIFYSRLK